MDGGPDSSPLERRIAPSFMAGDEEQDPVSGTNRALQRAVDRLPCAVEAVAVQIERSVGLDPAAAQAPIPSAIKRRLQVGLGPNWT